MLSLFSISLSLLAMQPAFAQDLGSALKQFDENPKKFIEAMPEKIGKPNGVSFFSIPDIQNRSYIKAKNSLRPLIGKAKIKSNDRPEELVDAGEDLVKNINDLEKRDLHTGQVSITPWSDYYWPLFNGQLAYRYGDQNFPSERSRWTTKFKYIEKLVTNLSAANLLSPAEKYDLLIGDESRSLTMSALGQANDYYEANGTIEQWMGICHGWAPASYALDRPEHTVTAVSADGATEITFFPSDIKALASLLWAENPGETNFIGGRCDEENPKTDKNGRVKDQDCFDTNPGAWHLSVLNQIGIAKKSFVMDATYDYEVWNQPVTGYSFEYFNPQTKKPARTLQEATVAMEDFTKDTFADYRPKRAKSVVGVRMTVAYSRETAPTVDRTDSADFDAAAAVSYLYDLELDSKGEITGGEWYHNVHPDFLWTPSVGSRAFTAGDERLIAKNTEWNPRRAFPADWAKVAKKVSAEGSPLALVVEGLIQQARSH